MKRLAPLAALLLMTPGAVAAQTFNSTAGDLKVETVARGLSHPWAIAFLPDGRILVTERPGRMRIVGRDGTLSPPLTGVPQVVANGQPGLLDVVLDRGFADNRTLYLCYSHRRGGLAAVARAKLVEDNRLGELKVIFRENSQGGGNNHGCRIAQAADNTLFVTLGDHFGPRDRAQDLSVHNGKVVRISPDGLAPTDNPFVGRRGALPEIWSYGHRNPQGLAFHPTTGALWLVDHGPRGGDEVNIVEKGKNYGWPVVGYGVDYSGARIYEAQSKSGMVDPLKVWVPSIAPSGLAFYQGELFPAWRGSLFLGALAGRMLVRLTVEDRKVTGEERLLRALNERIRDVRNGPDGALYLATDSDNGRILRLVPAR